MNTEKTWRVLTFAGIILIWITFNALDHPGAALIYSLIWTFAIAITRVVLELGRILLRRRGALRLEPANERKK